MIKKIQELIEYYQTQANEVYDTAKLYAHSPNNLDMWKLLMSQYNLYLDFIDNLNDILHSEDHNNE